METKTKQLPTIGADAVLPACEIISPSVARVRLNGVWHTVSRLTADGGSNVKLRKNATTAYDTLGLSLSPAKIGGYEVCPSASPACRAACLNECGNGYSLDNVQTGRLARKLLFFQERQWFLERLNRELWFYSQKSEFAGRKLAARLNVFSDIPWESFGIVDAFPNIQFYDYTKRLNRVGRVRPNYWVTASRSETNELECLEILGRGDNVAIAFADLEKERVTNKSQFQRLPKRWNGFRVIDGDKTDLRFTDPRGGIVVGLRLKAPTKAKRRAAIASGFAVAFGGSK